MAISRRAGRSVRRHGGPTRGVCCRLEGLEPRYVLNAAPVLDVDVSLSLPAVDEGDAAPEGQVGALVSTLIDSEGVLANFSDADGDDPGIAITRSNPQGGVLWYSINDGVTWNELPTVSEDKPLFLAANSLSRVYFQPAADFIGTITDVISFKAWDQSGVLVQLGDDINGEAAGDWSGSAVALSADGSTVAIGAVNNSSTEALAGHVRLFRWTGAAWEQFGSAIPGEAKADGSGVSVALSADGQTVAIGAAENDGNGDGAGQVRVYRWAGDWQQLGEDLDGAAAEDALGTSVALSADGETVVIGAPENDGNEQNAGLVRVYRWNGAAWKQLGNDLQGLALGDRYGTSVSVSADGARLLAGAPFSDDGGQNAGYAFLHGWLGLGWSNTARVLGEAAFDRSGSAVSLSADGRTFAVGAIGNAGNGVLSGHVRVYRYTGTSFDQLGGDIDGEAAGDLSGYSVSLSGDGQTLAVGAYGANDDEGSGNNFGHVRLYRWSGTAWEQFGPDIDGEAEGDESGWSVALSTDGQTVAIGSRQNSDGGAEAGHVRVYRIVPTSTSVSVGTAKVRVSLANVAPVLNQTPTPILGDVEEDSGPPVGAVGTPVSDLVDKNGSLSNFSDADGDAAGLAITGVNLQGGSLWCSSNGGLTWTPVPAVSANSPQFIVANEDNRLYFQPPAGFHGTIVDVISFRAWDQYGVLRPLNTDIDGDEAGEALGSSIAMSANGQTIAIGAPSRDVNGVRSGQVRVYRSTGTHWEQVGASLDGVAADDQFGGAIALSDDGKTVAIGGAFHDGFGGNAGHVRVYRWTGTLWEQRGSDLVELDHSFVGRSVAISADGEVVAVGARAGGNMGSVSMFRWSGSDWMRMGAELLGESAGDSAGEALDLSANGMTVAIGAPLNQANGIASGHVRIYRWLDGAWGQVGSDIDGLAIGDRTGESVSLSDDGKLVAIGSPGVDDDFSSGRVEVFSWTGTVWEQRGQTIVSESQGDRVGASVSLSADGMRLAVGAPRDDGTATALRTNTGQVRLYGWTGSAWERLTADINGQSYADQSGSTVVLSDDGQTLAIGVPGRDGAGEDAGAVSFARLLPGYSSVSTLSDSVGVTVFPGNRPPESVSFADVVSAVQEDADTSGRIRVATVSVVDDGLGINTLSLSGSDAINFELDGAAVFLKAGTVLDYETQRSLSVTVEAVDASFDPSTAVAAELVVSVIDVNEPPTAVLLNNRVDAVPEDANVAGRVKVAEISVVDDALGSNTYSIAGDDADYFEVVDAAVYVRADVSLDYETRPYLEAVIIASDPALPGSIAVQQTFGLEITNVGEPPFGSVMTLVSDGRWFLGKSNGSQFDMSIYGIWNMNVEWTSILQGDVNGDGLIDVIGRTHIGQWWVTLNQGDGTGGGNLFLGYWKADMGFSDVVCADFNGDGRDDVAGRTPSGQWWVGLSNADRLGFTNQRLARWTAEAVWAEVLVGDFNGDGMADIAGLADSGVWWGALGNEDGTGDVAALGVWSPALGFGDITTGDFNADGKTDIVGRAANGQWWAAMAKPDVIGFNNELIGGWSTRTEWTSVASGDFNGDGSTDIVGRASNGQWWGLMSDGTAGGLRTNTLVGYWSRRVNWTGIITGDADGDGRDDIVGRVASSQESARGRLWMGRLGEGMMQSEAWGFVGAPAELEAKKIFFANF